MAIYDLARFLNVDKKALSKLYIIITSTNMTNILNILINDFKLFEEWKQG